MNSNHRKTVGMILVFLMGPLFLASGEGGKNLLSDKVALRSAVDKWKHLPLSEVIIIAERGDSTAQHFLGYQHSEGAGSANLLEAIKWYRRAAESGLAISQNSLGLIYERGEGVQVDHEEAVRWYEKASAQGWSPAMSNLARLMKAEKYPETKGKELRELFERHAKNGDAEAQIRFGHFLLNPPTGGIIDTESALFWYKKAYRAGRNDACFHIGEVYIQNEDKSQGVLWYQRGIESGDIDCRVGLSWALLNGLGTKSDPQKGLALGEELAKDGHTGAMYNLGRCYGHDDLPDGPPPLPRDIAEALKWYRQAAEGGHIEAMAMLGRHLVNGPVQEPHFKEGVAWLKKADRNGLYRARRLLAAVALKSPESVPDGIHLIEEIAQDGYDEFQVALAEMFRHGHGVPVDLFQSSYWALMASDWRFDSFLEGIPGLDSKGALLERASDRDREYGIFYRKFLTAMKEKQPGYFVANAERLEKEVDKNGSQLFSSVCYEVAASFGDEDARRKAALLRKSLDRAQGKKVDRRVTYLLRCAHHLAKIEKVR